MPCSQNMFSLIFCLLQTIRGFVVKKQRPKEVIDVAAQRYRWISDDDALAGSHSDPHGRLSSWIRANARPYLPIRHPRTTLDVHVSAGLYQIVDLVRYPLSSVSS
ncbi:hypothetical protein OSTOST_01672 [Ostertagia ostertagi]